MTPSELLRAALKADPTRPLFTHYDDATGERVELSVATTDNWVSKTANLLRDGVSVEPGERVALLLPVHWQTGVLLLACWAVGAVAVPLDPEAAATGGLSGSDVVVSGEEWLPAALDSGAREVVGLSLRPMGGRLAGPPPGVTDYAEEVLGYGDTFAPWTPLEPSAPALDLGGAVRSGSEVAALATEAAARLRIASSDRVLTVRGPSSEPGLVAGLLAPLAAGAGIVTCRHLDPGRLAARCEQERVTALVGLPGPVRRLDG